MQVKLIDKTLKSSEYIKMTSQKIVDIFSNYGNPEISLFLIGILTYYKLSNYVEVWDWNKIENSRLDLSEFIHQKKNYFDVPRIYTFVFQSKDKFLLINFSVDYIGFGSIKQIRMHTKSNDCSRLILYDPSLIFILFIEIINNKHCLMLGDFINNNIDITDKTIIYSSIRKLKINKIIFNNKYDIHLIVDNKNIYISNQYNVKIINYSGFNNDKLLDKSKKKIFFDLVVVCSK